MTKTFDIGFIGGDIRQIYLANLLLNKGYSVAAYGLDHALLEEKCYLPSSFDELIENSKVIMGPIPFSKNGNTITTMEGFADLEITRFHTLLRPYHKLIAGVIPEFVCKFCTQRNIPFVDLMKLDRVAILNAIATAEGTILEAMKSSPSNLHGSHCLILGYGRCAKVLAEKLHGLHAKVTIGARSKVALASAQTSGYRGIPLTSLDQYISKFDYIFNTIPSPVITDELLSKTKEEVIVIDIASAPGGVDFQAAESLGRYAKLSLGLPGKVSPKTSALILFQELIDII